MLLAGETLFLRGGGDAAILNESGGAVVIEGGNSQDPHQNNW